MTHDALIPEGVWNAMFTRASLKAYEPKRGQQDDRAPMLEVFFLDERGARKTAAIMVVMEDFNDVDKRFHAFQAIGRRLAEEHWRVVALRLVCAGWQCTVDGPPSPDDPLPRDAPNREEVIMVAGVTLDSRCTLATAVVLRDKVGRVRAVRPWQVLGTGPDGEAHFYLLNAVWKGYLVRYAVTHGLAPAHPELN